MEVTVFLCKVLAVHRLHDTPAQRLRWGALQHGALEGRGKAEKGGHILDLRGCPGPELSPVEARGDLEG